MKQAAAIVAALAICAAAPASGRELRSPLKHADMTTIHHDAAARAKAFMRAFRARSTRIACFKTTPWTARCNIRLIGARRARRPDCSISTVYVVVGDRIEAQVARDHCD